MVFDVRQRLGAGGRGDDQITGVAVEAGGAQRVVGVLVGVAKLGKLKRLVVVVFRVGVRGVCHVMFQIVVGMSRFTCQGVLIVVGADPNQHCNRIREPMGLSTNSPNSPHCGR